MDLPLVGETIMKRTSNQVSAPEPTPVKEPSTEYQNFEKALKHALTVPKAELDRRLEEDKARRK
jgi:hypothetical protein